MLEQYVLSEPLAAKDPEVAQLIEEEKKRLKGGLEMIPSENFVSQAVLDAMSSPFTNKYSEGYPKRRYYGGNEVVDKLETLTIKRAKIIFPGAEHINVQPYSGSPANLACYLALLKPGDKIMGMRLDHGGHLTHGHKVSASGIYYNAIFYGVDPVTGFLDYEEVREIALREKPKLIISGFSAYPREVDFEAFHEIAKEVGAYSMADISHIAGLVVAKEHPSPFPFTDVVTTTTHKTLRGPRGAIILSKNKFAKRIDKAVFPGLQGGPHNHTIAAKAVAFKEASTPEFKAYAKQVKKNAEALGEALLDNDIELVTGGTDNHLLLLDLRNINVSGAEAETLLDDIGITCNKNAIPNDPRGPLDPSGIRLGTPALTTRGLKEEAMEDIGNIIATTLHNKSKVRRIANYFPLYRTKC